MGGAGFVFTGENDADIMYNSVSINLNVLEEVRKFNETFDGVNKEWTEANRPALEQPTKIFSLVLPVCIQSTTNSILIIPIAVKNQHTCRPRLRIRMGRNFSLSASTLRIIVIMAFLLGLLDITTFLVQRGPGRVEERKLQQQFVAK